MEHEMILVDADFKVVARMTARRKHDAGVAQVAEHSPRKREDGSSSDPTGPSLEESVR